MRKPPTPPVLPGVAWINPPPDAATASSSGVRQGGVNVYDPFGVGEGQVLPANTTTERYTGKWHKRLDTTSGLISMGVRPYDSALGRFMAVDPVEGGSANNYDFAGQNPVANVDLDGRSYFNRACLAKQPTSPHPFVKGYRIMWPFRFQWGERVRMGGGSGRVAGQLTPPA